MKPFELQIVYWWAHFEDKFLADVFDVFNSLKYLRQRQLTLMTNLSTSSAVMMQDLRWRVSDLVLFDYDCNLRSSNAFQIDNGESFEWRGARSSRWFIINETYVFLLRVNSKLFKLRFRVLNFLIQNHVRYSQRFYKTLNGRESSIPIQKITCFITKSSV